MSASTVNLVTALCSDWTFLQPLLNDHLEDNGGEILPHLLLSDIVRWMSSEFDSHFDDCVAIWQLLGRRYRTGDSEVKDLIVVSGVEMIPDPGLAGSGQRNLLSEELQAMDPWR